MLIQNIMHEQQTLKLCNTYISEQNAPTTVCPKTFQAMGGLKPAQRHFKNINIDFPSMCRWTL
jgi:hypothetical protein